MIFVSSCCRNISFTRIEAMNVRNFTKASPTRRWESREEILNSHLDSLTPTELLRERPSLYALRFGWQAIRRAATFKNDPSQPRVPAGNPDGGQWTGDESSPVSEWPTILATRPSAYLLAAGSKQSASYCWQQMQIDMMLGGALRPTPRNAACRAQANERYSACLSGKPIPPLPF